MIVANTDIAALSVMPIGSLAKGFPWVVLAVIMMANKHTIETDSAINSQIHVPLCFGGFSVFPWRRRCENMVDLRRLIQVSYNVASDAASTQRGSKENSRVGAECVQARNRGEPC